ncbi:MAG: DEAD/DEAH box helicase [Verrucomicrobia bacterium]|nr:DEAD/DEAH box helicase [Verrucomicrobiota bacterium]
MGFVDEQRQRVMESYRANPALLLEHHNIELNAMADGHAKKQIMELVQNGADAILESKEPKGKIRVVLTPESLTASNTGAPLGQDGVKALMGSHRSTKEGKIGRFGLGFKSLLHLHGKITVLSRGGENIQFDPDLCRKELFHEFGEKRVPGFRLAWTPAIGGAYSQLLPDPESQITTIIHAEILSAETHNRLKEEIESFPLEMILFLEPNIQIEFLLGSDPYLKLEKTRNGSTTMLQVFRGDRPEVSEWKICARLAKNFDPVALQDATLLHARESSPILWAIPLDQRPRQDSFWAFFPTKTASRVPGIINSFWKLDAGRDHLIEGAWNRALLEEAAQLVSQTLLSLTTAGDPGNNIDYFPRKGEEKNWAADAMIEKIWEHLVETKVIANAQKDPGLPKVLLRPPLDDESISADWECLTEAKAKTKTVHHRCLAGQRKYRLEELYRQSNGLALRRWDLGEWLGATRRATLDDVRASLRLCENIHKTDDYRRSTLISGKTLKDIALIPSENGEFLPAISAVFFTNEKLPPNKKRIRKDVSEDAECRRILVDCFGLTEAKDAEEVWTTSLEVSLREILKSRWNLSSNNAWESLWTTLRGAPRKSALFFIEKHQKDLRVQRTDHLWVQRTDTLRPGAILKEDDHANHDLSISRETHGGDMELLDAVGVRDHFQKELCSYSQHSLDQEQAHVLRGWITYETRNYQTQPGHPARPREDCISIHPIILPSGSFLLAKAQGRLLCELTWVATRVVIAEEGANKKSYVRHTNFERYQSLQTASRPFAYLLTKYGAWWLGDRPIRLATLLDKFLQPAVRQLFPNTESTQSLDQILSWLRKNPSVDAPNITDQDHRDFWNAMMGEAMGNQDFSVPPESVWDLAAEEGVIPETLRIRGENVPFHDVKITRSRLLADKAQKMGLKVVSPNPKAFAKWQESGCPSLEASVTCGYERSLTSISLEEFIPGIRDYLRPDCREITVERITKLRLVTSDSVEMQVASWFHKGAVLVDHEQLENIPAEQAVKETIDLLAANEVLTAPPALVYRDLVGIESLKKREEVYRIVGLANKIAHIFKDHPTYLLEAMEELKEFSFLQVHAADPQKLAELVLARHGIGTLAFLRPHLQALKYEPPEKWGTSKARLYVSTLGFPDEYAISTELRRDAEENVQGPMPLPELHDFQKEVFQALHELWQSGQGRRRAVISLPTGAGKTRVTVQAATELFLKHKSQNRILLWVAQSDELCEQAVQAFGHVWRNCGSEQENLKIIRFWGGHPNPGELTPDRPVVVVASVQTLASRMGQNGPRGWQERIGLAVFDECHHAIAPSYTGVLRWLDVEGSPKNPTDKREPMILGLSATPFRADDSETRRLAKRFDQRWFPSNQDELFKKLKSEKILAQPFFEKLETGASVDFTPDELKTLLEQEESSFEVERLIEKANQVLATHEKRNIQIIELIRQAKEGSILLFANSVLHAEELSARLILEGIPAAAVRGETPKSVRRHFIQRFMRRELRVMVNHSIFYAGFDAPKTDMILITRLVQSPVRYMQMVGRGLRGPKNGGTETCRIVTLLDNLREFSNRHPYHYCAQHYS